MRIETIYDQGTTMIPEDRTILNLPFVGIADGVSGLYTPLEGPRFFANRTGGQTVVDSLAQAFISASQKDTVIEVLGRANMIIRQIQEHLGFYASGEIEHLAGTTFAVAKIGKDEIEILQCGDCMALWVSNNGKIKMTKNQVFSHEMQVRARITELMRKYDGNRFKTWQELAPIIAAMRRQRVNRSGGYGFLNGQFETEEMWQRFILKRQNTTLLLLFTDGLVHPEETENEDLGQKILMPYQDGGLRAILAKTRKREERERSISHIDHAEASGVAIIL